jgi:hypothetical protein
MKDVGELLVVFQASALSCLLCLVVPVVPVVPVVLAAMAADHATCHIFFVAFFLLLQYAAHSVLVGCQAGHLLVLCNSPKATEVLCLHFYRLVTPNWISNERCSVCAKRTCQGPRNQIVRREEVLMNL